ncbi:MAG: YdbL family protein [Proteobacteria bacterium]|jgi:uncharacterized protein|nr:YdbL family protein [Pseudomonadota bacterium]
MKTNKQTLIYLLASAFLLLSASVYALDLGQAKAQGLVGETNNGYLATVVSNAEADEVVNSINAQRRAHYQAIADRNGTSIEAVESVAGQKAIELTPAGQYINTGGGWVLK